MFISPCIGKSITIPASVEFSDIIDTVSEHLPGLVRHPTVVTMVDHYVVHNVLDVGFKLLQDPVNQGVRYLETQSYSLQGVLKTWSHVVRIS